VGHNLLIRQLLQTKTEGDVLVVDGVGYLGYAPMGSNLAEYGRNNGWSGAIIFGAVRDVGALFTLDFAVKALGSNPLKGEKHGLGHIDAVVSFGGVSFAPGHCFTATKMGSLFQVEHCISRS
jgi:regulator of ribonuclease activity A